MKGKNKEEKEAIKLRFAVGLEKALTANHLSSYRSLASSAGLESAHIQKIANGKVDVGIITSVCLAEGLKITSSELFAYYDGVTEQDIYDFLEKKKKEKRERDRKRRRKPTKGP